MLAKCYEHDRQFVEALKFAAEAIRVDSSSWPAFRIAVSLAIAAGEHERASRYLRQALTLPEMTTEMPQGVNTYQIASRGSLVSYRGFHCFADDFAPRVAAAIRELDAGHRAVELQQWKRWALEYLAWQSGDPPESNNSVLH